MSDSFYSRSPPNSPTASSKAEQKEDKDKQQQQPTIKSLSRDASAHKSTRELMKSTSANDLTESTMYHFRFEFDLSPAGLITSLLSALWGIAKASFIQKYRHDFHSQETVDLLKDEMKKIQEKLDTLLTADLRVAGTYFVEANTYLGLGDEAEAISRYREAKKSAIEAIHRVQKIDQLVQAYKIRLLSEYMKILITCKSICEEEEKAKKIRNFCITALASLNELHTHPKIVSAVEHQLDPPLLGKKSERELLLSELHKLDYWIISVSKLANLDLKAVKKQLITNTKAVQVDPLQLMELLNNLSETLEGHTNSVWSVCSSGDKIVSGSWDHSVRVWDMNTCECVHFLQGHTDDKTIRVWNLDTGDCLHVLEGHDELVGSISISGDRIVSGSADHTIRVWSISTGACLLTLEGHFKGVSNVYTVDDEIVSGSYDNTIRIWDINSGICLNTLEGHSGRVWSISIAGEKIISSNDNDIRLWDLHTGTCLHVLQGHSDGVYSVHCTAELIISGSSDNSIRVWDLSSGECLYILSGHTDGVYSICAVGDKIISGSQDSTIRVWDIKSGACVKVLHGHTDGVHSVCTADDKIISGSSDNTIRIWDMTALI